MYVDFLQVKGTIDIPLTTNFTKKIGPNAQNNLGQV